MARQPYMPTPMCPKPGCDRKMHGMQIVDGLSVSHCKHHADWALGEAKAAAAREAAKTDAATTAI